MEGSTCVESEREGVMGDINSEGEGEEGGVWKPQDQRAGFGGIGPSLQSAGTTGGWGKRGETRKRRNEREKGGAHLPLDMLPFGPPPVGSLRLVRPDSGTGLTVPSPGVVGRQTAPAPLGRPHLRHHVPLLGDCKRAAKC